MNHYVLARGRVLVKLGTKLAAILLTLGVALAISATGATAAIKLGPITTFGSLAQPNDVAVNQSNGEVFVADVSTSTVHIYIRKSATEYEQVAELTGAETPEHSFAFHGGEPAPVAVDSSSGALYIGDIDHHVVDKFVLTGPNEYKYECQITGFHAGCHSNLSGEEGTPEPHFGETTGVAIDSHGDVFVSDFNNNEVDEFTVTGGDVGQIISGLTQIPANLTIDALGNLYLSKFDESVQKLKVNVATGAIEGEQANLTAQGRETRAVGVDPLTNEAYIDQISQIYRFDSVGNALSPVTLPGLVSEGVAVDGGTREVYVSDRGHEDIAVFGPVTVPDVKTEPASEITDTSALLEGEVNPLGTSEASTYFEYGETTAYGATAPSPPGDTAGSGTEFTAATPAKIEGLVPGTIYHFRLDATNSAGVPNEGEDLTFTTPPEAPKVDEPPAHAANVTSEGAVFHGTVQPGNGSTAYHFVYGTTEAYDHALPSIGIGSGFDPVEVEQATGTALAPGTKYHFALIAENAGGMTVGHDETIETASTAPAPTAQPTINLERANVITQTEVVLSASIDPESHATTYAFELGYAPGAYETRVFGSLAGEPEASSASATFTNLQPGVVYHYRVVATNAAGTTATGDQTFATAQFPQSIAIPSTPLLVPTPVFPAVRYGTTCKKGYVKHGNKCVRKKPVKRKKSKKRRG
jgi:hypothetical protein